MKVKCIILAHLNFIFLTHRYIASLFVIFVWILLGGVSSILVCNILFVDTASDVMGSINWTFGAFGSSMVASSLSVICASL